MSKMIDTLTNRTKLMKIAAFGGFLVAGMGYLTRWVILNKLHKSEYYRLAVVNFHSHTALVQLLGPPIYFGTPELGNNAEDNYSTLGQAKFTVPVKGTECKGNMLFEASRNSEDSASKWHLHTLLCDVEKTEKNGTKLKGRINVPIKYPTIEQVPDGIYNYRNQSMNNNTPTSSTTNPNTVSTSNITSNA